MRNTIQTFFLLAALLTGCSQQRNSSVAQVKKGAFGKYEIRLDHTEWSIGGPCNLTTPHKIAGSDWIYCDKIQGEIGATNLILTNERGKTAYPWPQQGLSGFVTFSEARMHIALKRPVYLDGVSIDHYEPYPLNGDYTLQIK